MKQIITRGAEAIIYKEQNTILKERPVKKYRLPEIDAVLRKQRTRKETKILEKIQQLKIPVPNILNVDEKTMTITMEFIPGPKVKDILSEKKNLAKEIGQHVGKLHENNIIHGDLTTSNMIYNENKVYLIDFGLSFVSQRSEDKAVDLQVFERALESTHYQIFDDCLKLFFEGYKETNTDADKVLERLEKVLSRGRNKNK
ncbi:Kae1-associated kinase Bud32 [Candidatus Woesearchaeota archaeon CG10_big_fil_rev_8_21_14_0_10_37_12]|nr:MAG: Kae1-associated kinase Bud32 [Candidatus Woesearchaeota archaeon CG10_big_fil_rev_8_21_14_0_10_37_12]